MKMNQKQFEDEFLSLLEQMKETCLSKNHDYAGEEDPLSNLRQCEKAGIPAWKGIIAMRMQDKNSRLLNFCKKEEVKVKSESVVDTLMDNAVYSLLAAIAYKESVQQLKHQLPDGKA